MAHGDGDWHIGFVELLGFLLTQIIAMLTGSRSRRCLLNTAAAIVVYFAYSFLVPTIFAIAAQFLDWFKDVQPWVDFTQAQQPLITAEHDRRGLVAAPVTGIHLAGHPVRPRAVADPARRGEVAAASEPSYVVGRVAA